MSCIHLALISLIEQKLKKIFQQTNLGQYFFEMLKIEVADEWFEDLKELWGSLKRFLG